MTDGNRVFYLKVVGISFFLLVTYWLGESCLHAHFFPKDTFSSHLFPKDSNTVWMRIDSLLLLLLFLFISLHCFKQNHLLSEKLLLFKIAVDNLRQGCLITNHENKIVYINKQYEEISGYHYHEVVGQNPNVLSSGKQDKIFYKNLWKALSKQGFWEGEIWNRNKLGELYPEWISIFAIKNAHGKIQYHVGIFSDITSEKAAEEKIKHYAYHDPLTQLPNRRFFLDNLNYMIRLAKRQSKKIALIFIDLDHFKVINDKHGHLVGDQFLCAVAKKIQDNIRSSDIVSRFGGDEFVILLYNVDSKEAAKMVAQKILTDFENSFIQIGEQKFKATLSIGGAIYPDDASDADALLHYSDRAMYRVKKTTRHNILFHE